MRRVAVIGAGAAGSMAAIFAASRGARTVLLERKPEGGRKILISGGGRCNILPAAADERRFVTGSSPHRLAKIVRSWPLPEQIAFFEEEVGIPLVTERETAKMFPASQQAQDVRDGVLALARSRGTRIRTGVTVTDLARAGDTWRIETAGGESLSADAVVVATGGLSVPETGSDGLGLEILRRLGHEVRPTHAALTPLLASPAPFADLAGVSQRVRITARDAAGSATATGPLLFTHRGYSGPAVLDISHVAVRSLASGGPPAEIRVRWSSLGEREWAEALLPRGAGQVGGVLHRHLPVRLARAIQDRAGVPRDRRLSELRKEERRRLKETLVSGILPWTGHEGYRKAEVTGGGVSLSEIDPRTMESRRAPGLFICGEVLDAFGPIGGYNFLWAWATGRAAGTGAAGPSSDPQ